MTQPLRVRIHLNLAKPELAESAVRIQSPSGAWVTVGYATELALANCKPVVDLKAQSVISQGAAKKTPHAFIEGDLVHFRGREREQAPPALRAQARPFLKASTRFSSLRTQADNEQAAINYNPRFASCFYCDAPDRTQIHDKFVASNALVAMGWKFLAIGPQVAPLLDADRCAPEALAKASIFEHLALRRGRQTTERLMAARPRR
jgi:hypothetical protein